MQETGHCGEFEENDWRDYWSVEYVNIGRVTSVLTAGQVNQVEAYEERGVVGQMERWMVEEEDSLKRMDEKGKRQRPKEGRKLKTKNLQAYVVEKRNARERNRVRAVNEAFARLRQVVPTVAARGKRVSKVKTLKKAVEYILELRHALDLHFH